jgi:phage/plasmid-like protein (TIGR03299 family)
MFSVRETPWHSEGKVLRHAPKNIEEAIRLAGLNFSVAKRELYFDAGGEPNRVDDFVATVREDRNAVLGIVGRRYTPLQNLDAFRILQPLIDSGRASLETAGALWGGADVWVLVRFNVDDPVVQEVFADEVVPFALLSNNHAGDRAVTIQDTPIRVVCANTLGMAHRSAKRDRAMKVRHTVTVEARTIDAANSLYQSLVERSRMIAEQYRILKQSFLTEALFRQLVLDVASPVQQRWLRPDATKQERKALASTRTRRDRLHNLWTYGAGHKGDLSAWEAYNAVAESLDHDVQLWKTRGLRTESLFAGRLADLKQTVLDGLMTSSSGR